MEPTLVTLLAVIAALALAWGLRARSAGAPPDAVAQAVAEMRADLMGLSQRLAAETASLGMRLEGIDGRMTLGHTANQDLAQGIFDALGDVRRATTQVAEQAREFSALQDMLKAPKARGGLGEAMLEELLRQILPPAAYEIQHRFSSGAIVDAIVRMGGKIVPIDSKFPLENHQAMCKTTDETERLRFERAFASDVDRHIRAIAERYIVPDEDTFEFAVMYVPAEGIYGEVLRLSHAGTPLFESAIAARVVPMSPLTLYGYLQTVLYGLRCLAIEERAEAILGFCGRLEQDMTRFAAEYETLGRHLTNAKSKYEEGSRRLDRFRSKLERVTELGEDDPDRPSLEAVGE